MDKEAIQLFARTTRPKGCLTQEHIFSDDFYNTYSKLLIRCTKVRKHSTSFAVKAEYPSMVRKMRGLLALSVKCELDFAEVTTDPSNIVTQWSQGLAAGTRAFIPDTQYRDECYAALKILSCASEEAKNPQRIYWIVWRGRWSSHLQQVGWTD